MDSRKGFFRLGFFCSVRTSVWIYDVSSAVSYSSCMQYIVGFVNLFLGYILEKVRTRHVFVCKGFLIRRYFGISKRNECRDRHWCQKKTKNQQFVTFIRLCVAMRITPWTRRACVDFVDADPQRRVGFLYMRRICREFVRLLEVGHSSDCLSVESYCRSYACQSQWQHVWSRSFGNSRRMVAVVRWCELQTHVKFRKSIREVCVHATENVGDGPRDMSVVLGGAASCVFGNFTFWRILCFLASTVFLYICVLQLSTQDFDWCVRWKLWQRFEQRMLQSIVYKNASKNYLGEFHLVANAWVTNFLSHGKSWYAQNPVEHFQGTRCTCSSEDSAFTWHVQVEHVTFFFRSSHVLDKLNSIGETTDLFGILLESGLVSGVFDTAACSTVRICWSIWCSSYYCSKFIQSNLLLVSSRPVLVVQVKFALCVRNVRLHLMHLTFIFVSGRTAENILWGTLVISLFSEQNRFRKLFRI